MSTAEELDAIGIDRLRENGSPKWSVFLEAIGAPVAEMDFPAAPSAVDAAIRDALDRADRLPARGGPGSDGRRRGALAARPLRLGGARRADPPGPGRSPRCVPRSTSSRPGVEDRAPDARACRS
jgi:hypothetical protein